MQKDNEKIKYFLYCRKSTEDKERQLLSLESQEEVMRKIAEQNGWKIVKTFHESKSAKAPDKRVFFAEMMIRIKNGEANGIICWELSRLARNPDEAGKIMGMLQRGEIKHIKTYSKDYYSDDNAVISSVEFGMANQYSRDVGKGVKRGIDKKAAMGWRPGFATLGYLNTKTNLKGEQKILNDPERFHLVKQTFQLMLTGNYTVPRLWKLANDDLGLTVRKTKKMPVRKLHLSEMYKILSNPFYYGWYEWTKRSGNWIKGNHEPMIIETEFDRIQFLLGRKGKPRPQTHKFAFTGLMKCPCGAGITAEEKFKRQKNGNIHRYIYYHCTRKISPDCTEKSVELKDLEKQIDTILADLNISPKFQEWAIKYLHEIRTEEAQSQEVSFMAKQRRLEAVIKQLDNLVLLYTSPENADGQLISSDELKNNKSKLLKEKSALEEELNFQGKEIEEWVELTEKTFNFARYARAWFTNGDMDTKRAIFACLGSDLLLKDQKVALTLHKPLQVIFEKKNFAEQELTKLEPLKFGSIKGKSAVFAAEFPIMSG
ncbi:MAG: recombinase family protein [Candidatus Taylorbacteria bacterium]|nr:recombinase family protein [Candidatus Taylorbacteria bacterium]